jgi:hypothetical protein
MADFRSYFREVLTRRENRIWKCPVILFTLYYKVLFMEEKNPETSTLREEVKDIKRLMERSSRFISLSGLSGIAAGVCALIGAWIAHDILSGYYGDYDRRVYFTGGNFEGLKIKLIGVGAIVFVIAFLLSFYLTWRKAKKQNLPVWDYTSRRLFWNMVIPLVAGGLFIVGMLQYDEWRFIAPACLVFYGLALINASKYTLTDIRYLGYFEILLGIINIWWIGYGLYFWAMGFGILHIIYGVIMWWKYERE